MKKKCLKIIMEPDVHIYILTQGHAILVWISRVNLEEHGTKVETVR